MKLWKKVKNRRLSEKDKIIYLPLEPIHLELDLENLKCKSPLCHFTLAVFRCPDLVQMIFEGPTAYVLFIFFTFKYHICDISYL